MQAHWNLENPKVEQLQNSINILSATGVKISITELDIGILPKARKQQGADINANVEFRNELNPYTNGVPAEVLQQQADKYRAVFGVLLENKRHIERVTFWGVTDKYTWHNDWPVKGRTAHPLLFDREYEAKPAYLALKELGNE
jgi:endo-1,4-beta-xylanase